MFNFKNIKFAALSLGIVFAIALYNENIDNPFIRLEFSYGNFSGDGDIRLISIGLGNYLEDLIIVFMPYISLRIYEAFYRND